ncbi:N-acetylmuramoyl-L-alanine amidase family protein [Peredibacter starrii]|uniref:N-acetylmuramoyl-L-alanine amidase n=1 Tax=Peredibacter starrii TaxID=28202 RepID=A0AAX4HN40_9BACT|nr:N-acetylmuramoyl-L-alanine amidase [Peredibacter starrii]WPU64709.1 N-acetylmuramoyl-L-alanine amidase [Peredibacter starrii]
MKFLALCFLLFTYSAFAKVVLIDPGHGGEEVGAIGHLDPKRSRKVYEKDLSLRLSKKIKEELSKHTSAYLTRSIDRLVTLPERAELADLVKADLFLSIHFNSSTNARSHGFELYYLDNNSNVAANKVERAENLNLQGEELIVNQILVDLVVQQTVVHSRQLASLVHEKVKPVIKKYKIDDRGVKPGLFYVLALSKRPGLLVEAGFVSNPNELKKVNEEKYLNELARSISAGVIAFINAQK